MTRPRILMADDHSLVLAGLRRLVEDEGDVVGIVEDGRALLEEAQRLLPDIILLDISMPLLNGLDAARQLKRLVPDCKLIFLTVHATPLCGRGFKAMTKREGWEAGLKSPLLGSEISDMNYSCKIGDDITANFDLCPNRRGTVGRRMTVQSPHGSF